jgi:hypothetical protein
MFVGHYAFGFFLKKKFKEIPLWLLFVSVQLVDILAFLFVLLGVERIRYVETVNPFLRTSIEYVPYSHSLFSNVITAFVVFLLFWKLKNNTWGLVLSMGVLSHWFLDVIVHTSDMPVFLDGLKTGLGLWRYPQAAFFFENTLLIMAGYYLLRGSVKIMRSAILIILLLTGYTAMFFAPAAEATPTQASIVSISLYSVFTALAYWSERAKSDQ